MNKLYITSDYKASITRVVFDNIEVTPVPYGFGNKYINFMTLFSSNGGSYDRGIYNIIIEADGYEDYSGTIEF